MDFHGGRAYQSTSLLLQAGPGTIAEAMIRGLPIILNDYIAGQVIFLLNSSKFCRLAGSITSLLNFPYLSM